MSTENQTQQLSAAPTLETDERWRERAASSCLAAAEALSAAIGLAPGVASAAVDVTSTLTSVLNILSNGIQLLGAIVIVMGLVNLGQSLRDNGGGERLASALSMIVGGIVVSAAGTYFKSIDTNILG